MINQIIQHVQQSKSKLIKGMSSDQNYLEMRVLIQKHKDNERIYKEKISQVNLTRARIHDQLEILKQAYGKKVKSLEQKLQNMKLQNQTLLRQNLLFKTQIDTYQNRLLEKQKIIAVLLNQKRQTLPNGNSQKSKSDKTQSNQAIQQQGKHFKKQIPTLRDSPQDVQAGLNRYEKLVSSKINAELKLQTTKFQVSKEKDNLETSLNVKKQIGNQQQKIQPLSEGRSIVKQNKVQIQQNQQTEFTLENSASNYFQSLSKNKQEQENEIQQQLAVMQVRKKPSTNKKKTVKSVPQPPAKNLRKMPKNKYVQHLEDQQLNNQTQAQSEVYQETTNIEQQEAQINSYVIEKSEREQQVKYQEQIQKTYEQPNYSQAKPFDYAQHFANANQIPEQFQVQNQEHKVNYPIEQRQEESESDNNFLSHFNSQPQNQQEMVGAAMQPKPLAKKKKTTKRVFGYPQEQNLQQDHSINSSDFFSQLNKHQHEVPHQFDIEQSSIDHNDRDSSLISNEQHYFAQQQTVQKSKNVKMTKKKGKRDQIKVADPSLFQ